MADSLLYKIPVEIAAVIATITTGNGYSVTVPSTGIVHDALDRLPEVYTDSTGTPRVEIMTNGFEAEDLSNEEQQITVEVEIRATLKVKDGSGDWDELNETLTHRKQLINFAGDIRKALLSSYTRQQAGDFSFEAFGLIKNLRQRWDSEDHNDVLKVITNLEYTFFSNFDTL